MKIADSIVIESVHKITFQNATYLTTPSSGLAVQAILDFQDLNCYDQRFRKDQTNITTLK
jgi:hypothetical protein